jgi:tetratricopeptide (TPR) repeat protein
VEQFQQALELDNQNEKALGDLARSYENLGDATAAVTTYQKAIAARPGYWAGYSWLGAFYYRRADYPNAEKMFQRVLELAPDNFRGHSNLGAVYVAEGRYSDAIQELKRSTEIRATADGLSNLGTTYFALRRFPEAADAFDRALKMEDSDWLLWGNFADSLYWSPQRRAQANDAYRKAIELGEKKLQVNPKDASVLGFMATYFAMLGDKENATKDIQRALAAGQNDPEVRFRVALAYLHLGDKNLCLDWLAKSVDAGYAASALQATPDFDPLRTDPKFDALAKKSAASASPSR